MYVYTYTYIHTYTHTHTHTHTNIIKWEIQQEVVPQFDKRRKMSSGKCVIRLHADYP